MKKKHFSLLWRSRRHDAPDTAAIMEVERKNILSEKSDFFIRESYKTLRTNVTFSLADEIRRKEHHRTQPCHLLCGDEAARPSDRL